MFGRKCEDGAGRGHRMRMDLEGLFAMRGDGFGRGFGRGGRGRGFGDGGQDDGGDSRIGRFLLQGDLRLLVLALIEKEPRHGYEIIRHVEELTYGFYVPSPGVIYPTLTYLEEAGYITAETDGNKKRYSITDEGRAHLDSNRGPTGAILERLSMVAERLRQRREGGRGRREEQGPELPRSVEAALLNLREVMARRLGEDERRAGAMVKLLLQIAEDLDAQTTRD
ncbi:PadR family transcriptional regulator [Rhizobium sp. CSW-27]|uniref:PadR family transcriptional regulator n=1 Tax=Rhizobium sp. CSW-27 TaxID=2839985 RepID=UPI001C02E2CA|nr:PadR family transcriptional regulator [Rhizobium sp. CSW-27]MBT9370388.1 PadR family transcriptional regulator [Rhizobium sp. CSW-27]